MTERRSHWSATALIACVVAFGVGADAAAHDDVHGKPHFKGTRASPTAVMRALKADAHAAQGAPALSAVPCVNGFADVHPCHGIDLLALVPLSDLGGASPLSSGNDVWGWTASGREFAIVGGNSGTSFVEITGPVSPDLVGFLPTHTVNSSWRDIKVYANHAFIVSEAGGHGMQVFDLTQLLGVAAAPVTFAETALYNEFGGAHNIAINEDTAFAYAVGTTTCGNGGLHMIDIIDPVVPTFAGCFSADGYTHDAQCVTYDGTDVTYQGREICFASNENTLTIVDVTDKGNPVQIARQGYNGRGYTHQAWLSEDHETLFLDDELDERNFGHGTRTRVWDVSLLSSPAVIDTFTNTTAAIDHNLYVKGDAIYQANYRAGLSVLHIVRDAGGIYSMLEERAYFDVYPSSDSANFNGAWSNYSYFPSGTIVVSGIEQGLFVLALNLADEIKWMMPANDDDVVSGADVPLEFLARDGELGAAAPTVEWRLGTEVDWNSTVPVGNDLYEASLDSTALTDDTHELVARMTDADGNPTLTSIWITVSNNGAPPTAGFTSPADGDTVGGNITLMAAANDYGSVVAVTFARNGQVIGNYRRQQWLVGEVEH